MWIKGAGGGTGSITPKKYYHIIRSTQANGDPVTVLPPIPPKGTGKLNSVRDYLVVTTNTAGR